MLYKVALSEIILPLDSGGNRSIDLFWAAYYCCNDQAFLYTNWHSRLKFLPSTQIKTKKKYHNTCLQTSLGFTKSVQHSWPGWWDSQFGMSLQDHLLPVCRTQPKEYDWTKNIYLAYFSNTLTSHSPMFGILQNAESSNKIPVDLPVIQWVPNTCNELTTMPQLH